MSARSTRLGYLLAVAAAAMWALNGSLARFLLDDGVSALRLAQLRTGLSWLILAVALLAVRPALLRVRREDVPGLAFLGIVGLAGVSATYFLAIDRLEIGVALAIQYLGPLLILVWLRVFHHRRLRRGLWVAAAVSVVGAFLVVGAYDPGTLDALGVAAAFGAALTYATYLVASERAGRRYAPVTTLVWGFGFASLFWAAVQPLWWFPLERFDSPAAVCLGLGVALVGTLLPFACIVTAVRHIPASRAAVVATLEPVLGGAIAYVVHDEVLDGPQIAGGLLVVGAVIWLQTRPISVEVESAPEQTSSTEERTTPLSA